MNLEYFRKKNNLTQKQLAEELYVKQNTLSQWETGRSFPSEIMLIRLSDRLGCTIDELVRGEKK